MKKSYLIILFLMTGLGNTAFQFMPPCRNQDQRVRVYFFLAEECPVCRYYAMEMRNLYEEFGNDFEFKGVFPVSQSSSRSIEEFGRNFQIPFPLIKDVDQMLTKKYGIRITPEVLVVDEQDQVLYQGRIDNAYDRPGRRRRIITAHELSDALKSIKEQKDIPTPRTQAVGCYITIR